MQIFKRKCFWRKMTLPHAAKSTFQHKAQNKRTYEFCRCFQNYGKRNLKVWTFFFLILFLCFRKMYKLLIIYKLFLKYTFFTFFFFILYIRVGVRKDYINKR